MQWKIMNMMQAFKSSNTTGQILWRDNKNINSDQTVFV